MEETASALFAQLEQLDYIVHDFMACVQQVPAKSLESTGSASASRLEAMLGQTSSGGGAVLGQPVLVGTSPEIEVESLLGFLGTLRKTGLLRVHADNARYMISIVRGDVVHGVCNPRPRAELLGSLLLARGAIRSETILRFFETCGSSASRIVEALNSEELVSTSVLREVLCHQMQLLFDRLLKAERTEWCFHEGEATLCYVNLRVNVNHMLLESARCQDESCSPPADPSAPAPVLEKKLLELVWPGRRAATARRRQRQR